MGIKASLKDEVLLSPIWIKGFQKALNPYCIKLKNNLDNHISL